MRVIGAKELSAKMLRMRYLCNNACSATRTVLYDNMPAMLLLNAVCVDFKQQLTHQLCIVSCRPVSLNVISHDAGE